MSRHNILCPRSQINLDPDRIVYGIKQGDADLGTLVMPRGMYRDMNMPNTYCGFLHVP